ncbi:sigma factor-like helix-turn-helix DNA-binding protein [Hoeflea sp.]|uniref:sigma factor-like helix-turn-helix DNA-binding protein n=1 Tax=Hoeflea sp. TaxID=1940281 RepID=UPI003BB020AA
MNASVRAFLFLHVGREWKITVHRELHDLVAEWKGRPEPEQTSAIVHIGFERPRTNIFTEIIELYESQVLLTASAKFGLPTGYESSESPVASIGGYPLYLATKGWGYLVDTTSIQNHSIDLKPASGKKYGWVANYVKENPEVLGHFDTVGICDDNEYLEREVNLPLEVRTDAGMYRHRLLMTDKYDPCDFARASPPWFLERDFKSMGMTVRIMNVFHNLGINNVSDLTNYSYQELLRAQNFGRTSGRDLLRLMSAALSAGPYLDVSTPVGGSLTEGKTLLDEINASLARVPMRASDILRKRMGLGAEPQTLKQIGEQLGITRERVRQIESKTLTKILDHELWDDLLSHKMSELLQQRNSPLPLKGIDLVDDWFSGIGTNGEALQYLLEAIPTAANVIEIAGIEYVGLMTSAQWELAVSNSRKFLDASADSGLTIEQCKSAVNAELPSDALEFSELLWDQASRDCHFVDQNDTSVLVGYGRGAEQVVHAVLASSEQALHYSDVCRIVTEKTGREYEIRRIHSACANVGHLFGLGTYGLDCHIPLSHEQLTQLSQYAEDIVKLGPPGKQWHANELLAELVEVEIADPEICSKYILDIALKKYGQLESFGRLVWGSSAKDSSDDSARIDVRQAVLSVLENAGTPLDAEQIRLRVREMRGLDKPIQIPTVDPILRLGPRLYGLNDRDIGLKLKDQVNFLDGIVRWLEERKKGVHQSELRDSAVLERYGITNFVLFSLAGNDPRMRVSSGRHLYLEEWGEPRCKTVGQVVKDIMDTAQRPLAMDDVIAETSRQLGRAVDRVSIVSCLKSIDAQFDVSTAKWSLPELVEE